MLWAVSRKCFSLDAHRQILYIGLNKRRRRRDDHVKKKRDQLVRFKLEVVTTLTTTLKGIKLAK